jgi:hypothetical protein
MLLQGRINTGVCPNCSTAGMLTVPLAYHDPEKELLYCFVPQELQMNESERQKVIGELSNAVINNLPTEARRGYLLQPQIFLSFRSLIEAILEADGITKEMLQAQQDKIKLISDMIQVVDDPLQLAALIGEHEEKIDREFFSLLAMQINNVQQAGQQEMEGQLTRLHESLLERTDVGKEIAKEQKAVQDALLGLDEEMSRQDLLQRIVTIEEEYQDQVLSVLVAVARPLIDYQFFQLLTEQVDQALERDDTALANRLKGIRDKILEIAQDLDAQVRLEAQARANLLRDMMQSSNPKDMIRAHIDELDQVFMSVLEANIAQTQESEPEAAQRLMDLRTMIIEVIQESAPPELRFVSHLMSAEYPDETRQLLSANQEKITPQMLGLIEALSNELESRGEDEQSEKLKGVLAQAQLMT